jgi:hypothetical protein
MDFVTLLAANEALSYTELLGMDIKDFLILTKIHEDRINERKKQLERTKNARRS